MRYFYTLSILCVVIVRFFFAQYAISHLRFENLLEQNVRGIGIVIDEPDQRENSLRLVVEARSLNGKVVTKTKMLFTVGPYADISYGDQIEFSGKLETPKNFETESGTTFDYVHFLAKDGILYDMYFPKITGVAHEHGNFLFEHLLLLKYSFLEHLAKVIPESELSLLGGLLLGTKQSLGKKLLSDFQKTGVIHMVVISGYNVTIVAEGVMSALRFLPRLFRFSFSGVGVILFVLMTGASGASLRAGIMTLIAILGKVLGKKYDPLRALLFAAVCMVIYNPLILFYDPSFQLSFLATLGLIIVSPLLEPHFAFVTERYGIRTMVVATISIQLFLLPFLLYLSGIFSLIALPVNLLVLFPVPFTMFVGFIVGVLSYLSSTMTVPPAFMVYLPLHYVLAVVETAAHLRWAAVSVPAFPFWLVALIYLFYTFILIRLKRRRATLRKSDPRPPSN